MSDEKCAKCGVIGRLHDSYGTCTNSMEKSQVSTETRKQPKATPRHDWEQALRACPDIPPAKMSTLWSVAMHTEFGTGHGHMLPGLSPNLAL